MSIPDRLKLKVVDKKLFDEMSALCDAIERKLESGETAESLLQHWHRHARRRCEPYDFQTYWSAVSKETFVLNSLNPEPAFDKDAVYSEAIAVLDAVSMASWHTPWRNQLECYPVRRTMSRCLFPCLTRSRSIWIDCVQSFCLHARSWYHDLNQP